MGKCFTTGGGRKSEFIHQITDANDEGFGNRHERIHRNCPMAIFQQRNKNHRQSRFLGNRFLRQFNPLSMHSNFFAQGAAVFLNRRHNSYKQVSGENDIYYSLILILHGFEKKSRNCPYSETALNELTGMGQLMKEQRRILVVEDETPLAMMMVYVLTEAGFEVVAAGNGFKGFELATGNKFDLIILDVDLPGTGAFEICRELKQRHISCRTPIIFASRQHCSESRERAFDLGAADFIEKPFNGPDFLLRISACIKSQPHQESRLTQAGKLLETRLD